VIGHEGHKDGRARPRSSLEENNHRAVHFSLDFSDNTGYKESCSESVSFMQATRKVQSQDRAMASAGLASRQRQILDDLGKEYQRQLSAVLRHRELIKGSVYGLKTRCGNPTCHCAKPEGGLHAATVLSWSEAGKTRIRSLAAGDQARIRGLAENYRQFRQCRVALAKLQRQILAAMDRLEQALRLPPPLPASASDRKRTR
jgi:hypothetical protein